MAPEPKDLWDWDPMLVASRIFNARNIDHLVIGSAAIHYHGFESADGPGPKPAGNPPWNFTNNFEVSIPDEKIYEAASALLKTELFELHSGENCDTMYEGTGPLVKLQAIWSKPIVVNLILLPKTTYFPLPQETHVARIAWYPLGSQGDNRLKKLPFPIWQNLVLSLVHRAVAHQDQMARRSFARLKPETGRDSTWAVSVPDHWEAGVRKAASDLLKRRYQRGEGNESAADPEDDLNRTQCERPIWRYGLFGQRNNTTADMEGPFRRPSRLIINDDDQTFFDQPLFGSNNNTTADTGGVDNDDLRGGTLIPGVQPDISGETEIGTPAEVEEGTFVDEEVTVAEPLDQTADSDSQHGRSDENKKRKTKPDGDVHDGI